MRSFFCKCISEPSGSDESLSHLWAGSTPSGPGPTAGFIFFGTPQRKRTKRNGSLAVGISVAGLVSYYSHMVKLIRALASGALSLSFH